MKRTRIIAAVTALLLTLSCAASAGAADTAKATTMRLEATEGTVTLKNQNGKSLSIKNGMKLANGNKLNTASASYAYISLDDSKAVKLDASSAASVKKSGKQLQVEVSSGKLFFNVKVPLESDESLKVRTSTMVTGVRGTAGIVEVINEDEAVLYLLDGKVEMTGRDPVSGETSSITVSAGQMATSVRKAAADGGQELDVTVQKFTEDKIPGFAAVEIAKDRQLQQKIAAESDLDVTAVVQRAEQTLREEQADQREKEQEIDKALAQMPTQNKVDTMFGTVSGGSVGGSTTPTPSPDPEPTPPEETKLSGAITVDALLEALENYTSVTLDATASLIIPSESAVEVPNGKTLVIESGASVTVSAGGSLTVGGALHNAGHLLNQGSFDFATGSFTQTGSYLDDSAASIALLADGKTVASIGALNAIVWQAGMQVTLLNDSVTTGRVLINKNDVMLDLNGKTLDLETNELSIAGGGKFTVSGGTMTSNRSQRAITVQSNGTLVMADSTLTNSAGHGIHASGAGAAVTLQSGAAVSSAFASGYGISGVPGSRVVLDGGEAFGNAAGVYTLGAFEMNSGLVHSTDTGAHVAGVCNINGGIIRGEKQGLYTTQMPTLSDGTIELAASDPENGSFALDGAFSGAYASFGSVVRAQSADAVCKPEKVPVGKTIVPEPNENGWFTLR